MILHCSYFHHSFTFCKTGKKFAHKQLAIHFIWILNLRSGDLGYDFNAMNILQWISMLQEVYEKFDYNDVDCQKLLICEVLRDEDSFGAVSKRLQNGFE